MKGFQNIPLNELASRASQLDKNKGSNRYLSERDEK